MRTRRRSLVLVDESARHPFRQSLPPHVRRPFGQDIPKPVRPWVTANDWKGFFAAYCATFVAVMLFIS